MSKDTHDLDEFDFDDFGFDTNDDFGVAEPKADRNPVIRGAGIAKEAAKQIAGDKQNIRDAMRAALPKGYLEAFDVTDRAGQNVRSLYNEVLTEIAPGVRDFKKATKALLPKVEGIIPKKFAEKLRNWSSNDQEYQEYSKAQGDRDEISSTLSDIFDQQAQTETTVLEQQTVQNILLDRKQEKRSNSQLNILSGIQELQARVVGYQDNVLAKYHRKSLELQYRHYFAARDLLEVTKTSNEATVRNLADIVKNTALPDYLKINLTEDARRFARNRMFGKVAESFGPWTQQFGQRMMDKMRGAGKEAGQNFNSAASGLRDLSEAGDILDGASAEERQQFKDQGIASAISFLFNATGMGEKLGNMIKSKIPEHHKAGIDRVGSQLSYAANNWQGMLQNWAGSQTDWDNKFSFIVDSAKDSVGKFGGLDAKVDQISALNDHNPVPFDGRAHRSLTEIIPGFLARLLQSSEGIRTGKEVPRLVYNYDRGEFTTERTAAKDAFSKIIGNKQALFNQGVDEVVNNIDEEKRLSPEARKLLRERVIKDTHKGGVGFSPEAYSKLESFADADPEVAKELIQHIVQTYGVRDPTPVAGDPFGDLDEGVIGGTIRRLKEVASETSAQLAGTKEQLDRKKRDVGSFQDMRAFAPELGKSLSGYANSGQREILRLLGMLKKEGTTDVVDNDFLWRYLGEAGSDPLPALEEEEDVKGNKSNRKRRPPRPTPDRGRNRRDRSADIRDPKPIPQSGPTPLEWGAELEKRLRVVVEGQTDSLTKAIKEKPETNEFENLNKLLAQLVQHAESIDKKIGAPASGPAQGPAPDGSEGEPTPPEEGKRSWWDVRKWAGMGYRGGKWAGKKAWSLYTAPVRIAAKTTRFGWKQLKAATGFGKEAVNKLAFDVYVKGGTIPLITRKGILAGDYTDVNTGKTIVNFADITGPVTDREGNQVITQADIDTGLVNAKGKTVWIKVKKGIGFLANGAFRLGKGYLNLYVLPAKLLYKAAKKANSLSKNWYDVYVEGETIPRMTAAKIRAGEYVSSRTGKPIRSWKDIDGDVLDKFGNVVLSKEDAKKVCDRYGRPIRSLITRALRWGFDKAWAGAKLAGRGALWAGKKALKLATMPLKLGGKLLKGMHNYGFGVHLNWQTKTQTELLGMIYELLDKRLKAGKGKVAGDSDGDGDRDNNWKDILKARQDKEKQKETKLDANGKPVKEKSTGLFGKLLLLVGAIGTGIHKVIDRVTDVGTWLKNGFKLVGEYFAKKKAIDMAGDLLDGPDVGGRRGKKGLIKRAGKWVARNAKKVWTGARIAGSAVAAAAPVALSGLATAGSAVASGAAAAGGWALSAAGTIGSVLLSPWVLGAAAVAGVGYGAYKFYRRLGDLGYLRMAQYGFVEDTNDDEISKIRWLEDKLEDHVLFDQDGRPKLGDKIPWDEILTEFGYTQDNHEGLESLQVWMQSRFAPVYLAHRQYQSVYDKGKSLATIDRMDDDVRAKIAKSVVAAIGNKVLSVSANPLRGNPLPTNEAEIAKRLEVLTAEFEKNKQRAATNTATAAATTVAGGVAVATPSTTGYPANFSAGLPPTVKESMAAGKKPTTIATAAEGDVIYMDEALVDRSKVEALKAGKYIWTEASAKSLDALASVRYRAYGLDKLDVNDIAVLAGLEQDVAEQISYGFFGGATIKADPGELFAKYAASFGCTIGNKEQQDRWIFWFKNRFSPVLLTFVDALKRTGRQVDIKSAWKRLGAEDILKVAQAIISANAEVSGRDMSVWALNTSPFPNRTANTDAGSCDVTIEWLKGKVKEATVVEEAEKAKRRAAAGFTGKALQDKPSTYGGAAAYGPGGYGAQGGGATRYDYASGGWVPVGTAGASGGAGTAGGVADTTYTPMEGYEHPGKGSGGDINTLPTPAGDGAANVIPLLQAVAKMVGVDPHLLATMCAVESDFKVKVKVKDGSTTAGGLFQFINSTWKAMLEKYGSKYGIAPGTPKEDARANALLGAEYIRENYDILAKSIGRKPNANDLYMAHFLGPGGAKRVLTGNPNDSAAKLNPKAAASNPTVFYENDGKGAPRSVRALQAEIDRRMKMKTKAYNLDQMMSGTTDFKVTATDKANSPEAVKMAAGTGTTSAAGGMNDLKAKEAAYDKSKAAAKKPDATTKPPIANPVMNGSGGGTTAGTTTASSAPAVTTPAAAAAVSTEAAQKEKVVKADADAAARRAQQRAQQEQVSKQQAQANATSSDLSNAQLERLTSIDSTLKKMLTVIGSTNASAQTATAPQATPTSAKQNRTLNPDLRKSPVSMGG